MSLPATLIDRIKSGNVIPFVGAGVSRAVVSKSSGAPLFPSWNELLLSAAQKLDSENKSTYASLTRNLIQIDKPEYLNAANHAKDALGPIWYEFLKDQFDHHKEVALDESLELAKEIWNLGSKLVITTNYDRSLRWASSLSYDVAEWSIDAPAEQAAMMRSGLSRPVIWHLHGNIDDAANLILTPDGYARLYTSSQAEARYSSALQALSHLLQSKSFLFIGFSLNDEPFGNHLKSVSDTFRGTTGPHYALISEDATEKVRNMDLPGIEIVSYKENGDPLLKILKEISCHAVSTVTQSSTEREAEALDDHKLLSETHEKSLGNDSVEHDDVCDTPPPTSNWVGRSDELSLFRNQNVKVFAVTGIGGQGKSTLIAKFLEDLPKEYELWDWRDCKEESNTLHTHLVRLIERITRGRRRAKDLTGEGFEAIIKLFFTLAASCRGVFAFDNIDKYINAHSAQAVGGMDLLIRSALKDVGASKFIFTARPKLDYGVPQFLQIELLGLSVEDAEALLTARGLNADHKAIEEVHELTQGHPLWINLIATQVNKNRIDLRDLILKIRSGKEAGLPNSMLREVWKTLTPKQQKLLRYLAEMVKPETERQLERYVERELNPNQFNKIIRQLKSLDLVVVKSPVNGLDTFELHPLIREFVRRQYSQSERSPYISSIILFFDKVIVSMRGNLNDNSPYALIQNWTTKVELLVNSGDYLQALVVLDEVRPALLCNGYTEEFIRLAVALFSVFDWTDVNACDKLEFEGVCKDLVEVLAQMGRFDESEDFMKRFEDIVAGATSRYVCLCQMRTYHYWTKGEYDMAKDWGRRGVDLKQQSNIDTRHDCAHDLALAQRDSGEIETAMIHFLHGVELDEVCDPSLINVDAGGAFYGNIGRCLYLKKEFPKALICVAKSAWLLSKDRDKSTAINIGWASRWLGDILMELGNFEMSYICYRRAYQRWRTVSPPKADDAQLMCTKLQPNVSQMTVGLQDQHVELRFTEWLSKTRRFG